MNLHEIQVERSPSFGELPVTPASRIIQFLATAPEFVKGIDLNRFRRYDLLDPAAIYADGYRFAILEATWGLWVPPSFAEFWPRLLDAGFILLAYGFFRGDQDGAAQADLLLETVAPMYQAQGFRMPLFSDVEPFSLDTSTPTIRIPRWRAWNDGIRSETTPGAYSNRPSWQDMMLNEPLPADALGWPAHYADTYNPILPYNWPRAQCKFHQYGIAGVYPWCPPVPGMRSVVDVNRFYGTLAGLRALGSNPPAPEPEPEEPPMSELTDKIAAASLLVDQLDVLMDEIATLAEQQPAPPPPPPPPATQIIITKDPRANAFYSRRTNAADKPIMEIYPSDSAPTNERIQFSVGTRLNVASAMVLADGGMRYWQLSDHRGRAGEILYIREIDARLA